MAIVDDLLQNPGLYVGLDRHDDPDHPGAAKILVTPLPGRAGVSIDYEVFNPVHPDRIRGHHEHTLLARTHDAGTVLVVGHAHADSLAILKETEPGTFELADVGSPFPMKVMVSMPEPGRLIYSWWYGAPGEEPVERDVADVVLSD